MSLLPTRIPSPTEPLGTVNQDGTVTMAKNWWLLIYNLCLQALSSGGQALPADALQDLEGANADAIDVNAVALRTQISVLAALLPTEVDPAASLADVTNAILLADVQQFAAADVPNGSFTYAQLQNASATSVLGRASGTTGVLADIVAGADGQVLLRSGGSVAFTAPTAPAAGLTVSTSLTFALANDLAAVEGIGGTGMVARTAADTWNTRANTGTANRITVTNGDGVAGAPTYDISATYVGQASITTLGTITTGAWAGTAVAAIHGGTDQILYTAGDILYASTTTALSKLAVGTATQVLHGGTTPAYSAIATGELPALGGNPTQTVGLAAVNGVAITYLRSDGAPALDQTIAPTMSGAWKFSLAGNLVTPTVLLTSTQPVLQLSETDQAVDEKQWSILSVAKVFQLRSVNDTGSTSIVWGAVTRGTGTAISNIALGDTTNNNTYTFGSTGAATFSGPILSGYFRPTGSTVPANGMYLPAANTVGFATNSGSRVSIDATGNVAVAASPLSKSVTQVYTGVAGYRTADATANSATLTADTDLTLTFNETGHYKIEIELSFYEATLGSGGFQFDLNSGTATLGTFWLNVSGYGTALFGNAGITSAATATGVGTVVTSSTAPSWIKATGYVNVTVAGTLAIRWAQNTLLAIDPTTLKKGSSFLAKKMA